MKRMNRIENNDFANMGGWDGVLCAGRFFVYITYLYHYQKKQGKVRYIIYNKRRFFFNTRCVCVKIFFFNTNFLLDDNEQNLNFIRLLLMLRNCLD